MKKKIRKTVPARPLKNPLARLFTLGISTGLGLGYTPRAPGTAGSLLGLPLGLWMLGIPATWALAVCVVLGFVFSLLADRACHHWGRMDAPEVVSDEVLGMGITLLGLRGVVPMHSEHFLGLDFQIPPAIFLVAAFALFRLCDIVKPPPAKTFDRHPTGFGVVADDVVAGLYAAMLLWAYAKIHYGNPV